MQSKRPTGGGNDAGADSETLRAGPGGEGGAGGASLQRRCRCRRRSGCGVHHTQVQGAFQGKLAAFVRYAVA